MAKYAGIVDWFGGVNNKNYGFIKFLSEKNNPIGQGDIFFHHDNIHPASIIYSGVNLKVYPKKGDLVFFDIVYGKKGFKATNVTALNVQTLAKEFDSLSIEELTEFIIALDKNVLSAEILDLVKDKISYGEKFSALIKTCAAQSSKFDGWATVILANDLPHEIIFKRFEELGNENKRIVFVKFFDELNIDTACNFAASLEKFLSPSEILDSVKDKATYAEKFFQLIVTGLERKIKFEEWATILKRIFVIQFDKMNLKTIYFIINLLKLKPTEIVQAVGNKSTFLEKISEIIEQSEEKISWAQYLLDDSMLFRKIKICDDVMIFFMYETVKQRCKTLKELSAFIKLLQEKEDEINAVPRLKVIYSYICAGFANIYSQQLDRKGDKTGRYEYLTKCKEFMEQAESALAEIFNSLTQMVEIQSEQPLEKFFLPKYEAHILPPCTDIENCPFCEAVTWESQHCNYCPRCNCKDESCFRIEPNLELSAKDWSIIELTAKLGLTSFLGFSDKKWKEIESMNRLALETTKYNREFFTRIGGEFNRIYDLKERLKCRECGHYMRSIKKHSMWKKIKNIRNLTYTEHFAIFTATTFSCQNKNCSQKDMPVYLSYCWHCGEAIDSRDNHVHFGKDFFTIENGEEVHKKFGVYYSCIHCGAGYCDRVASTRNGLKYALVPGTICPSCTKCPKCGVQEFFIEESSGKYFLRCVRCRHEMNAPVKLADIAPGQKIFKRYRCPSCNKLLKFNAERVKNYLENYNYTAIPWR